MLQVFSEKCKGALKKLSGREDLFIVALIILVGFGGFGLGRLSKIFEAKEPIRIVGAAAEGGERTAPAERALPTAAAGQFIASAKGSKYHFPWCPGASQISEANKLWFASEEEARAAGYEPASNCPGLNGK